MLRKEETEIKTNNFTNKSIYEKTVLQIEEMLNMPELNRLLRAFGGYMPEGVSLRKKVKTLVGFSYVWDYRAKQKAASGTDEQARWLVGTESLTLEQIEAAMDLASKWGMVSHEEPARKEYDYILILGGARMSCLYRTRYAYELIQKYELKVREVVGLTGLRPIADSERKATDTYATDADTEFDLMKAAVQKEFCVSELRIRNGEEGAELNCSWMVEEYENSPSICLVAAPSSEPAVRRANTADTFQFWSELKNIGTGKKLLLVTSQIYVPYQHLEAVRILGLSGGHEIETLGFPREWSVGLQGLQTTENYLQEIRSTLQAMERLLDREDTMKKDDKKEITKARDKLDDMEGVHKDFEGKKKKNNAIMLNTVPKLVCFAMVAVVLIQTVGAVVLVLLGMKKNMAITEVIKDVGEMDIVTIGVTVIGIAVSVWVGLNIYLSLSKEESEKLIKKMGDEIEAIGSCLDKVEAAIIYQKGIMWQEFINLLDSQRNENMLAAYFAYQFNRLFSKRENTDSLDIPYIHSLIQYEAEYLSMTRMYENGEKMNCYNQSERLIKSYTLLRKDDIKGSDMWKEVISFYFDVQIADAKFYRNAVCLRLSGYRDEFSTDQMEDVCDRYKKLLNRISDMSPEYKDINSAKAYINNTIGYTYDLINQYEIGKGRKNKERCLTANEYMKAAVALIGEHFFEKKARYLRNLGLTYERMGDLDEAYKSYAKSIKEDMSDYKSWTTCGAVILKKFERANGISERNTLLSKIRIENPGKWKRELLKAKTQFEMSASEGKGFEDPYYKLVQVYTYLYMLYSSSNPAKKAEMRKGAEKYMAILTMMDYTGGGSMYAYRNYYEAIEKIKKANEINEKIKGGNDVNHMKELYSHYLQEKNKKRRLKCHTQRKNEN